MKIVRILLIIIAIAGIGVAVSYPIRYRMAQEKNDSDLEQLAQMRNKARQELIATSGDDAVELGLIAPQSVAAGREAASDAAASPEHDPDEGVTEADGDAVARSEESPSDVPVADDSETPAEAMNGGESDVPETPTEAVDDGEANIPETPAKATDDGEANIPETPAEATDDGEAKNPEIPAEATGDEEVTIPETPTEAVWDDEEVKIPENPTEAVWDDEGVKIPENPVEAVWDDEEVKIPENPTEAVWDDEANIPENPAEDESAEIATNNAGENGGNAAEEGSVVSATEPTPTPEVTPEPTLEPNYWDLGKYYAAQFSPLSSLAPSPSFLSSPVSSPLFSPAPVPTPDRGEATEARPVGPTPTPDRSIRKGPLPYALKDKVVLDKAAILPELRDIYGLNNDLIGWINIPDTVIDYPVVQAEDPDFYLSHDFYGEENINGQIILDMLCDPYTPSYNLVVSGHHMKNGSMFGGLPEYRNQSYWEKHKFLELDTLMERKHYILFACFYSADYDEDETGFRYNAIIDYKMDADRWLEEIVENQLYDTGIERAFGDEFITLTTCDRSRHKNGRFVVVGRRIREGETFE